MKDRKGNELRAGDRAFVPVVVVAVADGVGADGGSACRAAVERLDGGEPRHLGLLSHDVERATPACLAARELLAVCKMLVDARYSGGIAEVNAAMDAAEAVVARVAEEESRL